MSMKHQFCGMSMKHQFCGGGNPKEKLKMVEMAAHYIPKFNPSKPLGEDAFFTCLEEQTLGVADGVGGYAKEGIDSGIYARKLMEGCKMEAERLFKEEGVVDPYKVLTWAHSNNKNCEGASTACIATLLDNRHLKAVNRGDTGFLVIRGGKIVYHSPVQQSGFNCPRQLSNEVFEGPVWSDELDFVMEPSDLLILATDGLFDNIFDEQIENSVKTCLEQGYSLHTMVRKVCLYAWWGSTQKTRTSPFEKAASAAGLRHPGGKHDDITVIAARVAMAPCDSA